METKSCPICDERVSVNALVCPQCGNTHFPWQDEESQGTIGSLLFFLALLAAFQGGWMLLLALAVGGLGIWLWLPKRRKRQ
ncbi:MAG: hypothetical protein JWL77_6231 [Chthonomonadaceae bacterium]|nr:hypothetical protein [Chthonomonadaceae bacterium]